MNVFFQIMNAQNIHDVSLDVEMSVRLILRSLLWDMVGEDFATRGVRYLTNDDLFPFLAKFSFNS